MPKRSAGILLFRRLASGIEVLLVHPGGPFWKNKDLGAWSIPKGETGDENDYRLVARREFQEELGKPLPDGTMKALEPVKQSGGKIVHTFIVEGDLNVDAIQSNTFEMEWPPRSGKTQTFPEVDRAQWFKLEDASKKILKSQLPLVENLKSEI